MAFHVDIDVSGCLMFGWRKQRKERGQGLTELVLVVPALFLVICAILDFGLFSVRNTYVVDAAADLASAIQDDPTMALDEDMQQTYIKETYPGLLALEPAEHNEAVEDRPIFENLTIEVVEASPETVSQYEHHIWLDDKPWHSVDNPAEDGTGMYDEDGNPIGFPGSDDDNWYKRTSQVYGQDYVVRLTYQNDFVTPLGAVIAFCSGRPSDLHDYTITKAVACHVDYTIEGGRQW